jgi:hypothetical protein
MNRSTRIALLILVIGAFVVVVYEAIMHLTYSRIEGLTQQYGAQMQPAIIKEVEGNRQEGKMLIETRLEYFKVFDIISDTAKVFVVVTSKSTHSYGYIDYNRSGSFRYLRWQSGKWVIDTLKPEELIWDQNGSADGSTWPIYH